MPASLSPRPIFSLSDFYGNIAFCSILVFLVVQSLIKMLEHLRRTLVAIFAGVVTGLLSYAILIILNTINPNPLWDTLGKILPFVDGGGVATIIIIWFS